MHIYYFNELLLNYYRTKYCQMYLYIQTKIKWITDLTEPEIYMKFTPIFIKKC